jgi:hypothetical protein
MMSRTLSFSGLGPVKKPTLKIGEIHAMVAPSCHQNLLRYFS